MQRRFVPLGLVVAMLVSSTLWSPAIAEDENGSYFSRESALAPNGDDTVYVATQAQPGAEGRGAVWAFHAHPTCTGGVCSSPLKWVFTGAAGKILSPPAVGPDGTVYVGADDGFVYALEADPATDGEHKTTDYKWRFRTSPSSNIWGGPAIDAQEQIMYVGSMRGKLYAFDLRKGSLSSPLATYEESSCGAPSGASPCLWALSMPCVNGPCDNSIRFTPLIGPSGLVYVGTEGNGLFAVRRPGLDSYRCSPENTAFPPQWSDTSKGCVLWQFKAHGTGDVRGFHLGGAIDGSGDTLYVNDDIRGGGTLWALQASRDPDPSRCVLGRDKNVVMDDQDPRCLRWPPLTFASMLLRNRPVLSPDQRTLYVASRYTSPSPSGPNGLYALDVSNPRPERWSFHPSQEFSYSFAAVHPLLNTVFIGGTNGVLYALDALSSDNERVLWEVNLYSDHIRSTPIVSRDGTQVYIGARNRTFFAFDSACECEKWRFDTNSTTAWTPSPACHC